jgi:hypothetical protein
VLFRSIMLEKSLRPAFCLCPKNHLPHRGRHPDGKTSSSNFPKTQNL